MKRTGYSVYSESIKVQTKVNTLADLYPELPKEKYDIIYADPPWHYNGKVQFDKSSTGVESVDLTKNIFVSGAAFKYPTLKLSELVKLKVQTIAKDDSLLFLWTTNPHLGQAVELGTAWGFEYKTVAFVWNKLNHNPGQYTLSNCELCLLFKRGKIPRPRGARNIRQLVAEARKEHSRKPDTVRDNIVEMFPTQKRIELFARVVTKGWRAWGIDVKGETENDEQA